MNATPLTLILLATALIYQGQIAAACLGLAVIVEAVAYCIRQAELAQYQDAVEAGYEAQAAEMASRN